MEETKRQMQMDLADLNTYLLNDCNGASRMVYNEEIQGLWTLIQNAYDHEFKGQIKKIKKRKLASSATRISALRHRRMASRNSKSWLHE